MPSKRRSVAARACWPRHLERNRRDLEQLPVLGYEDLYRRYAEIVETQERLTQPATVQPDQPAYLSGQTRLDAIVAANLALDQVVADIQRVPGYADFLAEPNFARIQSAAGATVLVYLLATSAGGLALIVYDGSVRPVWLDELTNVSVREWLMGPAGDAQLGGWLGAYQTWLVDPTIRSQFAWFAALDGVTRQLWDRVMNPVALALRQLLPVDQASIPGVTIIPTGLLALLPLHAAWTSDAATPSRRRYFLDEFVVSYAPSALALHHAHESAMRIPAERLLIVEEPLTTEAGRLLNVHAEAESVRRLFDNSVVLSRNQATRQAVRSALPEAQVVHFSCHGANDWQNPLESGLLMADDEAEEGNLLTVRDLLEPRQTGGRLATLSACETGIVGTELPDEVVNFAGALLQAGFGGVVASLWSVADMSTAMLMEHFYRLWREEKLSPAQALRGAQRWVSELNAAEVAAYADKCYRNSRWEDRADLLRYKLYYEGRAAQNPTDLPFAHPWYWAAFTLTGV